MVEFEELFPASRSRTRKYKRYDAGSWDIQSNRLVWLRQYSTVPLPHPVILEMRCCIAKIIHESGMGGYIDKAIGEREDIRCLTNDGSNNTRLLLFGF